MKKLAFSLKKTLVFIVIEYLLYSEEKDFMTVELHEMN